MRSLKDILKESILDDIDTNLKQGDKTIKDEIKAFLNANYKGAFKISKKPNVDGLYEVSSQNIIKVKNRNITALTNGLFVWSKVKSFDCSNCYSLTSLKDAPKEVKDHFFCVGCHSLTSLKGAPEKVGGDFNCIECLLLTSLEGAPKEVGDSFTCMWCGSLESLKGAPEKVNNFDCVSCRSLISLEGAPKEVTGDFDCSYCRSLISLEGAPKEVGRYFKCHKNDECKFNFTEEDIKKVSNVKGYISI